MYSLLGGGRSRSSTGPGIGSSHERHGQLVRTLGQAGQLGLELCELGHELGLLVGQLRQPVRQVLLGLLELAQAVGDCVQLPTELGGLA